MRLGILGGTFDPVHYGHLLLAESCREQRELDQVWFLPAAVPPHKQRPDVTASSQRVEMLELAISGNPRFSICTWEIDRGGVNYTANTLAHLKGEDPGRQLFFLLGADAFADLPAWRDPQRICQLAELVVVRRPGQSVDFSILAELVDEERLARFRANEVEMPQIGLSASDLRARVAARLSIRYRTPRAVEKYIETHGLYRGARPGDGV